MTIITIIKKSTGAPLFSGEFPSLRHCVEAASALGLSLEGADLRGGQFRHASLDGADLRGACLDGADFTGANLSECRLEGASAAHCDFTCACLAESTLAGVDFTGATFAATILTGAHIDQSRFSCPTAFTLPFALAHMGRNEYWHDGLIPLPFTAPPIVITGLPNRIVLLDGHVLVGNTLTARKFPVSSAAGGPRGEMVDAHDLKS